MNAQVCTVPGCRTQPHARGLCQPHYSRFRRGQDPATPYLRRILNDDDARFDLSVEMDPNGGCWLWSGATSSFGHGVTTHAGRPTRAHRRAYERWTGPVPDGLSVCHRCDVPQCVNPDHLFAGTQAENVADMMRKGRYDLGGRRWQKGSECPRAKLTEDDVKRVLAALASGRPQQDIADQYGITQTAVSRIALGRTWRHVPRAAA